MDLSLNDDENSVPHLPESNSVGSSVSTDMEVIIHFLCLKLKEKKQHCINFFIFLLLKINLINYKE
jgi:hypothetical protein